MKLLFCLLTFVAAFSWGSAYRFKTCSLSSPDHEKCLNEAIEGALRDLENGSSEFNFPNVQPVEVTSMTIGEGTGAVHVVQKYKDVHLYNLMRAKVTNSKVTINDNELKLSADLFHDEVLMEADYDFNGQILVVPIVGVGKCTLKLKQVSTHMELIGEIVEKKGKRYIEAKELKASINPGKVEFDFKNLFNGDKTLGDEMNRLLNENWKDVFLDVKEGYEELLGNIFKNYANIILKKTNPEETFPK